MLTATQTRALAKLAEERGAWFTKYDAQARRGTLDALVRRQLAQKRYGIGGTYVLRGTPLYRITDLGWETYQKIKQVTNG